MEYMRSVPQRKPFMKIFPNDMRGVTLDILFFDGE
jgi:hypothetical protein